MRTREAMVTFLSPFSLQAVGRLLPAGTYRVITDEELIEGLSFPAYRRVATMIFVPGALGGSVEMVSVEPGDLHAAQARDVVPRTKDCDGRA